MQAANPCLTCGACCAYFRVSFYWGEADPEHGGTVPPELTEELTDFRRCMAGTNRKTPRCAALLGDVGLAVRCAIYDARPTPCREFGVTWDEISQRYTADDLDQCTRARAAFGLPPLSDHPHHTGSTQGPPPLIKVS